MLLHLNLLLVKHLDGVVPTHAAVGSTAADEDDLGLARIGIHGRRAGEGAGGGGSRSRGGGDAARACRRDEGRLAKTEGVGGSRAGGGRGKHDGRGYSPAVEMLVGFSVILVW